MTHGVGAVIPAAGQGRRLGRGGPKAFVALAGWPLVLQTLKAFERSPLIDWVVVVAPPAHQARMRRLLSRARLTKVVAVVGGGDSRSASVASGLAALPAAAEWIVVHAGFHFTADRDERLHAGRERLSRIAAYAERRGAVILLENLNKEPPEAEVHYLAHTIEEWRSYFDHIRSPALRLSFTVNHAHLVPEGIDGFLDAFGVTRIGEVRLADNLGDREVHLNPGQGNIDFAALFQRLELSGYQHHYMMAFGSLEEKLAGRDYLTACWPES